MGDRVKQRDRKGWKERKREGYITKAAVGGEKVLLHPIFLGFTII